MRTLEIRRHSLTKKGAERGFGPLLSRAGVTLARRVGARAGPFHLVVASPVPRAAETAVAMGFAVDDLLDSLGPDDPDLFAEIGHQERWSWESPFTEFTRLTRRDGPTARLGHLQAETWRAILDSLPDGGRALAISHGRVIESGLVTSFPDADHAEWGGPFHHCEGVLITEDAERVLDVTFLRVAQTVAH